MDLLVEKKADLKMLLGSLVILCHCDEIKCRRPADSPPLGWMTIPIILIEQLHVTLC